MLSIYDSLNKLCEKLSRLEYVIRRKNLELILTQRKDQNETKIQA